MPLAELTAADVETILREHDDRASLGGLVGKRCQLRRVGDFLLAMAPDRVERRRHPVAECDGARLVQQQRLGVPGGLDRPAAHGKDVALDEPVHAGDPDGRQQSPDRGRDEADEKRNESHNRHACPCEVAEGLEDDYDWQEDDRQNSEQDGKSELVRGFLPVGTLDEGDHAVKKCLSGSAVTMTTIRSDNTLVPPVTAERSPPDSLITGADCL